MNGEFIRRLEPNIVSPIALNSPNTGIVDAEALIKTFERIAKSNGAHILTNTRVTGAEAGDGPALIRTEREEFGARVVINCAGLYADEVARMFGYDKHTIYPCRGEYAELLPSRARAGQRPGLSAASADRTRARSPLHEDHGRGVADRAERAVREK